LEFPVTHLEEESLAKVIDIRLLALHPNPFIEKL